MTRAIGWTVRISVIAAGLTVAVVGISYALDIPLWGGAALVAVASVPMVALAIRDEFYWKRIADLANKRGDAS